MRIRNLLGNLTLFRRRVLRPAEARLHGARQGRTAGSVGSVDIVRLRPEEVRLHGTRQTLRIGAT